MGIYRFQTLLLRNKQKGQSTVEYILLFAVIASIVIAILKSKGFNDLFGNDGVVADRYRRQFEFSYRHGYLENKVDTPPDYTGGDHDSYKRRFFSAADPYPEQ